MTGDDYVGIEDRYFAAAFLPETGAPPASLAVRYWKRERTIQADGKPVQEPVAEVAVNRFAIRLDSPLAFPVTHGRSEEHTSELQSRPHIVCRLLLDKKK